MKFRICVRFASTFNVVRVAVLTYELVICKDSNDCLVQISSIIWNLIVFINNYHNSVPLKQVWLPC